MTFAAQQRFRRSSSSSPGSGPDHHRSRSALGLVALCCAALVGTACMSVLPSDDLPAKPEIIEATGRYRKKYVLAPGDEVDVVVRQNPDISRAVVVRPDGYISLPLLDDVEAGGLTVPELDARITRRLADELTDPEVSVIATSVRPAVVYVAGEVASPAAVELRDAPTAVQAIVRAGGFKTSSEKSRVVIIRLVDDRLVGLLVEGGINGQPAPYMALQNVALQADDIVFVPSSDIAQFNDWLRDYVNSPTAAITPIINTYFQYRLIFELAR